MEGDGFCLRSRVWVGMEMGRADEMGDGRWRGDGGGYVWT